MNKDDNGQQPITDDAELAKVLDGMNASAGAPLTDGLQFEESPLPAAGPSSTDAPSTDIPAPALPPEPVLPSIDPPAVSSVPVSSGNSDLDSIKKEALEQLRPLVDRLTLPAEEKFDTLLLIIRSTDDQSLIGAAHTAAKSIEDETKRAQALLDVIKEIDYFANQAK